VLLSKRFYLTLQTIQFKPMKTLVSIIALFLYASTLLAQPLAEGRIVYDIKLGKETDPQMASMMPKEAFSWFKKGKSRFEMTMMMGMKSTTITDDAAKTSVVLMDMMGNKYAIKSKVDEPNPEAKKVMDDAKVTQTTETKVIAGYKCTKSIIDIKDKSGESSQFEIWTTKELAFSGQGQEGPLSKVDGAALEFSIAQGPITMTLTARIVSKEAVSDDKFIVPKDYKEMSADDFKKSMGGR